MLLVGTCGGNMVSGTISSGVDSNGEVDVETPPKPFISVFERFIDEAGELERTSMLLLGKASTYKKSKIKIMFLK